MLAAVKGVVRGNAVVIENEDIQEYDGTEVIVTLLGYSAKSIGENQKKEKKDEIDWDSFVLPSIRGKNVEEYMKEMRDGDRI